MKDSGQDVLQSRCLHTTDAELRIHGLGFSFAVAMHALRFEASCAAGPLSDRAVRLDKFPKCFELMLSLANPQS